MSIPITNDPEVWEEYLKKLLEEDPEVRACYCGSENCGTCHWYLHQDQFIPGPLRVDNPGELTEDEQEVLDTLSEFWDKWLRLPKFYTATNQEMSKIVNDAMYMLMAMPYMRQDRKMEKIGYVDEAEISPKPPVDKPGPE